MGHSSEQPLNAYRIKSAIAAASLIDREGSSLLDARQSYHHLTTQGAYPPEQLQEGQMFLQEVGLLVEQDGKLYPTTELRVLIDMPWEIAIHAISLRALTCRPCDEDALHLAIEELIDDSVRREAMLIALARHYDPELARQAGEAGEDAVVWAARAQLIDLGRDDLAARVHRVSVLSDQLGYDVTAPRLDRSVRLLEVKTCATDSKGRLGFFLSRNEADTGCRFRDWALVICTIDKESKTTVLGWCSAQSLHPYLPADSAKSQWTQARLIIPAELLIPGLPDPE